MTESHESYHALGGVQTVADREESKRGSHSKGMQELEHVEREQEKAALSLQALASV